MIPDFRVWVARMGMKSGAAAELIGIENRVTASATFTGKRELSRSERLAMSAVRAGLKPWTPEYDGELEQMARADSPSTAA